MLYKILPYDIMSIVNDFLIPDKLYWTDEYNDVLDEHFERLDDLILECDMCKNIRWTFFEYKSLYLCLSCAQPIIKYNRTINKFYIES